MNRNVNINDNINQQTITLKKLSALIIEPQKNSTQQDNHIITLSLNAEMMNLGFIMSQELFNTIKALPAKRIITLAKELITELRILKGAHITHQAMSPNFPEQVMAATDLELYSNALNHYWSNGQWLPQYQLSARPFAFENSKYNTINLSHESALKDVFTQLLAANDSLSDGDKAIVEWFMLNYPAAELTFPTSIPFQENNSMAAAILLTQGEDITHLINNSNDVLRVVTYLSDGDVSLASNTKFISLPRKQRKELAKQLERVITEEDIGRHKNKWKALFHGLHIGDYSEKSYAIATIRQFL